MNVFSQCLNWIYYRIICAMKPVPYSPFYKLFSSKSNIAHKFMLHWNGLRKYFYVLISKMGWPFPQVAADDLDQGQNGQVTYSIRSSAMSGLFKIDPLTGSISTAAIMDREIWTQTKWVWLICSAFLFVCNHILPCGSHQLNPVHPCLMFVAVIMCVTAFQNFSWNFYMNSVLTFLLQERKSQVHF